MPMFLSGHFLPPLHGFLIFFVFKTSVKTHICSYQSMVALPSISLPQKAHMALFLLMENMN